ncbi:MAG: pyridoxamine 5'-phosphate oxidase family protein [Acetatifactor sp.]|nr:pyridoxamine 5'-phosphate oxidase family protein [Acetatifactor sp.]
MRRRDREIVDFEELVAVMRRCDVCRLALNAQEVPYILPLNFGMEAEDGQVVLYFHGAGEGTKHELIARDNRASFEMDCGHTLILDDEKGTCSMVYESVVGRGLVETVSDKEKLRALRLIMAHYRQEDFPIPQEMIAGTCVLRLVVSEMSGKRRGKRLGEREA